MSVLVEIEVQVEDKLGPNKRRLFNQMVAGIAVPPGGGLGDVTDFFKDKEKRNKVLDQAKEMLEKAIGLVKAAPDNSFGDDEEAICGEILRQLDARKKRQLDELKQKGRK